MELPWSTPDVEAYHEAEHFLSVLAGSHCQSIGCEVFLPYLTKKKLWQRCFERCRKFSRSDMEGRVLETDIATFRNMECDWE